MRFQFLDVGARFIPDMYICIGIADESDQKRQAHREALQRQIAEWARHTCARELTIRDILHSPGANTTTNNNNGNDDDDQENPISEAVMMARVFLRYVYVYRFALLFCLHWQFAQ